MKRMMTTQYLELYIEVVGDVCNLYSGTILDVASSEFSDFETNILDACDIRGYQLEDSYVSNVENSISHYYIYSKVENGVRLKVLVKIRVSDHKAPDRVIHDQAVSSQELSSMHVKNLAKEIAKERYNQDRGYRPRNIDIIFDDDHYTSYESALRDIEHRLDEFDS